MDLSFSQQVNQFVIVQSTVVFISASDIKENLIKLEYLYIIRCLLLKYRLIFFKRLDSI